ncbi:hypothetical protein GEMRC1_011766 [Eukaryota sp. GEM-RC1]
MSDSTQHIEHSCEGSPKSEEMSEKPSSGQSVCYECETAPVSVFCSECGFSYCRQCSDDLHDNNTNRSHKITSLDTVNPRSLPSATISRAPLPADPLMKSPYVANAAFNELISRITELQINFSLHKYHSNVLPLIGSTGVGKTRTVIQLTRTYPFDDTVCFYAAFPRLQNGKELSSWPVSTHLLITWMTDILCVDCPLGPCVMSVVLCQILALSIFKMTIVSTSDDSGESWLDYHITIVGHCRDLFSKLKESKCWNPSDFSIDTVTKYLVERCDLPEFPKFILFLDEVGTLISHEVTVFPKGWNLYQALRHAARNLFSAFILKHKSFLIVVSGTHTSLSSIYHFPVRSSFNRPDALAPYVSSMVKTGRTIPPLIVNPQQYNPNQIITEDKTPKAFKYYYSGEYAFVAPGLSLSLVLSLRPLWISYFVSNPTSFLDDVQGKVWGALNLVSQKFSNISQGTIVAALLLIFGSITAVPESVLSLLIDSSFGNLECKSFTSPHPHLVGGQRSDLLFSPLPTIDPLVYSFVGPKL